MYATYLQFGGQEPCVGRRASVRVFGGCKPGSPYGGLKRRDFSEQRAERTLERGLSFWLTSAVASLTAA